MKDIYSKSLDILVRNFSKDQIEIKDFPETDLGELKRLEVNTDKFGITLEIWNTTALSIHLVDYQEEIELMNIYSTDSEKINTNLNLLEKRLQGRQL